MNTDDVEPLRRYAKTGDESAFAELVQRYLKLVYFAALRQVGGDTHRAEDVTQTVFTLLARKASSLKQHQSLAGWLHTTTRFSASDATRAERRRIAREQEAHTMHELTSDSAPDHECDQLRPVLDEVLGELSAPDREAVLLRFFASLSFAEVGARLHVAENAARMRVERALDKMRGQFTKRGVTTTTAAIGLMLAKEAALAAPHGLAASVTGAALASAGTGTLTALKLLQALAAAKFTVGTAVSLLLLSVGIVAWKAHVSHEAAASLAAAQQRVQNAEGAAARMRRLAAASRSVSAAAWDPVAEGIVFLAAHSDVKEALANYARAKVKFRYGPLYETLGLTTEQIAQFEDLMGELEPANDSLGIDRKRLVIRNGTDMARSEVESRLRDLLGADGYRLFQEFKPTVPARALIVQLAGALYFTATPLTAGQSQELIQIMAGAKSNPGFDWDAVSAQAKDVLSAPQLTALDGLRAHDEVAKGLAVVRSMAVLRLDPQLHARWIDSQRATVAANYGSVFRALNLSPEQFERFQDIKLRYEEQTMAASAAIRTQGPTSTEGLARLDQADAEYRAAATELLGENVLQILNEYKSRSPVREIVRGLAGAAALAGTPLSAVQGEQLTQLLADESWRYLRTGETDPQTIDWAIIDERARPILSDAQLKLFQTVEPEGSYGSFSLRFASQYSKLSNQAKRDDAGLPPVSAPAPKPPGR